MTAYVELLRAAEAAEEAVHYWSGAPEALEQPRGELLDALLEDRIVLEQARALVGAVDDRSGWPPDVRDAMDRLESAIEAVEQQSRQERGDG